MELFSRRTWTTRLAKESDMFGMMPCMCWITFVGFVINTTAYHLGQYSLQFLLLKSSMDRQIEINKARTLPTRLYFNCLICLFISQFHNKSTSLEFFSFVPYILLFRTHTYGNNTVEFIHKHLHLKLTCLVLWTGEKETLAQFLL